MEGMHAVDVSWLHHSNHRDRPSRLQKPLLTTQISHDAPPTPPDPPTPEEQPAETVQVPAATPTPTTPPAAALSHTNGTSLLTPPPLSPSAFKALPRRPGLLNRGSSERTLQPPPEAAKSSPRRASWISNISSKFSSSTVTQTPNATAQTNGGAQSYPYLAVTHHKPEPPPKPNQEPPEKFEPYVPQPPKPSGSSFFSNAFRRLSSGSQTGAGKSAQANGGVCPRKIMNVDPNRPRCLVPELDQNRLRRVAFSVDVEIAGGPRYKDDADAEEKHKKFKDKKIGDKGEGEALKHPQQIADEKDTADSGSENREEAVGNDIISLDAENTIPDEKQETGQQGEKTKRSDEERKARRESRRRKAEEEVVPVVLRVDQDDAASIGTSPPSITSSTAPAPKLPHSTDRPTTDPLRIYRRCCQLRESPVLKRISEQLAAPDTCPLATPGVVSALDLTGSRLQLTDFVTLSDWLAIVPVKRLLLEDAELTDEAVRVTLAGLLATKKSTQYPRRRDQEPPSNGAAQKYEERSGIIEKLTLKNNPRITKEGWKHVALFVYMCKSLKGLDVSMIPFPQTPVSPRTRPVAVDNAPPKKAEKAPPDMADIWSKAISERLGGNALEELVMGECQLSSHHIRKIIDAVTATGLKRLGLASNNIDDEGLEHVIRYVTSGVCQGLDLGGNDLRDRLDRLCASFGETVPLWALSLADCNLNLPALKPLFPALLRLQNLRFLDLSHNHELFQSQPSAVALLRKYLPMLPILKRIHLLDVALIPAQAIAIVEILPECSELAHINILENPKLAALAAATEEEAQEEACALYASLMAAARVSKSIVCIDIDKPSAENSEIVKALAKQVIAYCLRNLEWVTQPDQSDQLDAPGATAISQGHEAREIDVPDVLLHLVGQSEGHIDPHPEIPAPDNDYIVSGTGVVKALNYCLSEKAMDMRRSSLPTSGTVPPKDSKETVIPPQEIGAAKAKNMSKSLLESAKKIRERLRPALRKAEATGGDEMAYRRLLYLESTLQGIIQRFESEYPEVRTEAVAAPPQYADAASTPSSMSDAPPNRFSAAGIALETSSVIPMADDDIDDEAPARVHSRHNSEVLFASKALTIEEGQVHRLGQKMKRDLWPKADEGAVDGDGDGDGKGPEPEPVHLQALREKLEALESDEVRECVRRDGVEGVLKRVGEKAEYLKQLQRENPAELADLRKVLREKMHSGEGAESTSAVVEDDEL